MNFAIRLGSLRVICSRTLAESDIRRSSGIYVSTSEREEMEQQAAAKAQIARATEFVCTDTRRMEADDAEMPTLKEKFDVSRYPDYSVAE